MKILFLNYEFPPLGGGASPVSYEIAKGYVKLGHNVDVITMAFQDNPLFEILNGINIYRIPCLRSKKEICHPWEQWSFLHKAKKFLKYHLKNNKYDVNHTHFIIPTGELALWIKKNFNLPYIITSHGSDVLQYNKRFTLLYFFLKRPWNQIISNAELVTTPSEYLKAKILNINKAIQIHTIPNGIDVNKFKKAKKDKKILIVSRLFYNKGIQDILKAIKNIDLRGWIVDIVGDGPYKNNLMSLCVEYKLNSSVIFHGWLDNNSKKLLSLYSKAAIFLSASHLESFGLTVLEAISAGCYPLISDIESHRDIVQKEKYLFKTNDPIDLKYKLEPLLKNKPKSPRISLKNYTWSNISKNFERILKDIINIK